MNTAQSSALDSGVPAHTPGPWIVDREFDQVHIVAGRSAVARVMHARANAEANANLLAAAPEMLSALQIARNVLFLLADEVRALGLRAENVPDKITAAIARATARNPSDPAGSASAVSEA